MSNEKEENKTFTVQDKRRFDASGNVRSDEQKSSVVRSSTAESSASKEGFIMKPSSDKPDSPEKQVEMNFSSFVVSLATQALMLLGEIDPPEGVELKVDRNAAKQTIDILNMIEQKTKGNLEKEEASLLQEIIHNLRITYLRKGS